MRASQFFVKDKLYKYIGPPSDYFTYGKIYKAYGIFNDSFWDYNVIQTDRNIGIYKFDNKANGFGDAYWDRTENIKDYFKLAEHKTHLPSWW